MLNAMYPGLDPETNKGINGKKQARPAESCGSVDRTIWLLVC